MADQVKWRTVAVTLGAIAVLGIGGVSIANAAGGFARPEPTPSASADALQERSIDAEPVHPTPTPTTAAVTEAPPVEPPAEAAPVESGPDLCPPGTVSNGNDGYNDTSCMPEICYSVRIPDPAYPECDYFYPPDYYRG